MEAAQRKYYIDLLKTLSILFVIFIHTGDMGFLAFRRQPLFLVLIVQLFISMVCKTAVPLFFMCSGALLLNRRVDLKNNIKKILKYLFILILFSLLYYVYLSTRNNDLINLLWFFKYIYHNQYFSYSGCYWFIYSYISFLLIVPFLKVLADNIGRDQIKYLFIVAFIFSTFFPLLEIVLKLDKLVLSFPFAALSIYYPLIGSYIDKLNNEKLCNNGYMKLLLVLFFCIAISIIVSIICLKQGTFSQKILSLPSMIISITLFALVKRIYETHEISGITKKVLKLTSSCVFGIFLLHGVIMNEISLFINSHLRLYSFHYAIVEVVLVFGICFILTFVLKRIPLIKNIFSGK